MADLLSVPNPRDIKKIKFTNHKLSDITITLQ